MNLIYRLLGYSKYNLTHTNAAVLIQQRFQIFRKQQEDEREKLIKSINATYTNSGFTVISEYKNGIPIMYTEKLEEPKVEDDNLVDEMLYYRNERKRIKDNFTKESKLRLITP